MDYKDCILDEIHLEHKEWLRLQDQFEQKYPNGGNTLRYLTHPALPYFRLRLTGGQMPDTLIDFLPPKYAETKRRTNGRGSIATTAVVVRVHSVDIPSEVVVELCTVTDEKGKSIGFTDFVVKKPSAMQNDMAAGLPWMALCLVQDALINRPTIFHTQLSRRSAPRKAGSKKSNRVKVVKIITLIPDSLAPKQPETAGHTITCPCWGVMGHWRTYKKTGKRVWIQAYMKGKQRDKGTTTRPHQYQLVTEGQRTTV